MDIYGKVDLVAKLASTYAGPKQGHGSGEHADENVSDIPLSAAKAGRCSQCEGVCFENMWRMSRLRPIPLKRASIIAQFNHVKAF